MKTKSYQNTFVQILMVSAFCTLSLSAHADPRSGLADEISRRRIFPQPLLSIGDEPPSQAESLALSAALEIGKTNRVVQRIQQLEQFIAANPDSAWVPSIRANLAVYYRSTGRYSRALAHWEEAWSRTKNFTSGDGRKVADFVLASWSGLLSSLGRVDKLRELSAANGSRVLSDLELEKLFSASRRNLSKMESQPGVAYKCGTFALLNVGRAMDAVFDKDALKDLPSPETGFSLAHLVELAQMNRIDLVPGRRTSGTDLVVPSVVHFRQNHYAAILEVRDGLYRVVDPTFGQRKWLEPDAINEEASGYFLVPQKQKPRAWVTPTAEEMQQVFGKGIDGEAPYPSQPPCDAPPFASDTCPICKPGGPPPKPPGSPGTPGTPGPPVGPGGGGCGKCGGGPGGTVGPPIMAAGMPVWSVLEPYISVQLRDVPVSYSPGRGADFAVKMFYSEHEERKTNYFGFGPQWCSSLLSYVHLVESTSDNNFGFPHYVATNYAIGGGQLTFSYASNYPDSSTFTTFQKLTNGDGIVTGTVINYPDGSKATYGQGIQVSETPAMKDFFLTYFTDSHGNTTVFNYGTTNGALRLVEVVDPDDATTTIHYDASWVTRISEIDTYYGPSAKFYYDTNGVLTSIVDALGITNSFKYFVTNGYYFVTNLITPYGTTTFSYDAPLGDLYGAAYYSDRVNRAVTVTEPNMAQHMYMYRDDSFYLNAASTGNDLLPYSYPDSDYPAYLPVDPDPNSQAGLCDRNTRYRNSFYWGPRQYALLSTNDDRHLSTNDYKLARLRNWLHTVDSDYEYGYMVSTTLNIERDFSPDGVNEGQKTWYGYAGKPNNEYSNWESRTNNLPAYIAQRLPDGATRYTYYEYNNLGHVTLERTTNIINGVSLGEKGKTFTYAANSIDLLAVTNFAGVREAAYGYDDNHHVLAATNAAGEVTSYIYEYGALTSISRASGLTTTNIYFPGSLRLDTTIDLEIKRTNSYTWTIGQVYTHTDERGLTVTNSWDALRRLTNVAYPDGTSMRYVYDKLDLVRVIDRMGFTNSYAYDSVRHLISATDARGNTTGYSYCNCGSLLYVTNALQQVTQFFYDAAGRLTNTYFPDGYSVANSYDLLGQLISVSDGQGSATNWYDNRGYLLAVSNSVGRVKSLIYDVQDRVTNSVDANGVSIELDLDALGRLTYRIYIDGTAEVFGYSAQGLSSYEDRLEHRTFYSYDAAGRKLTETNPNSEVTQFSYSPAGDLLTLADGKTNVTTWHYDQFGRVTNKVDALTNIIFVYKYDANNRLTNRWTPAKTNTFYTYDPAGNLTNIAYAVSAAIRLKYDGLNRVTNMVDAVGTTAYSFTSGGLPQTEDGPWDRDTVTYAYNNRLRTGLNLSQPDASDWVQSYGYDGARRLTTLISPAGEFDYAYDGSRQMLVKKLSLPNGAYITNSLDNQARLLSTFLKNSGNTTLNSHRYGYAAERRIAATNVLGDYRSYAYDAVGQLTNAFGYESNGTARVHERLSYNYDAAGNLATRFNSDLYEDFLVNRLNQITNCYASDGSMTVAGTTTSPATNVTVNGTNAILYADNTFARTNYEYSFGTNIFTAIARDSLGRSDTNTISINLRYPTYLVYDLNGNLLSDGLRAFDYDDENQLTRVTVTNSFKSEFTYDGKLRRRIRREFAWQGAWRMTNEVHYVYDGNVVIQERDALNLPKVAYTRGKDLSGSLEGAGGIGGLLALTDLKSSISNPAHYFYHADGNGNVTMLINSNQLAAAKYLYDPFGNVLSASGPLAELNLYRFSSKEVQGASGLVYYGRRFYDPNLHRWINRDPIEERGGINLYGFVRNSPTHYVDRNGNVFGEGLGLAFTLADIALNACPSQTDSRETCDACCTASFLAGTAAMQAAFVYELASGGITGIGAIIAGVEFVAATAKFSYDYSQCKASCEKKPCKQKPTSPPGPPHPSNPPIIVGL